MHLIQDSQAQFRSLLNLQRTNDSLLSGPVPLKRIRCYPKNRGYWLSNSERTYDRSRVLLLRVMRGMKSISILPASQKANVALD